MLILLRYEGEWGSDYNGKDLIMLHRDCPRQVALILASLLVNTEADLVLLIMPSGQILAAQGYSQRTDLPQIAHLINGTHRSLHMGQEGEQDQAPTVHVQHGMAELLACTAVIGNRVLGATYTRAVPTALVQERMRQARNEVNALLAV